VQVDPEVERLRKEAEQATMRANQLANQLKAKEEAEAAQKAKELEEQNEFKTLYEQEKARREEIETAQAQAERQAAVKAASDKLFSEYPEQVKALAEEAGMSLSSVDDDAVAAFKAKLDKVSGMVAAPKVTANNPGTVPAPSDVSPMDMHKILNDPEKFQEYIQKNYKGISQLTRQKS
jgi:vacuolar-type H+-ATPase subunit E/Vma4